MSDLTAKRRMKPKTTGFIEEPKIETATVESIPVVESTPVDSDDDKLFQIQLQFLSIYAQNILSAVNSGDASVIYRLILTESQNFLDAINLGKQNV